MFYGARILRQAQDDGRFLILTPLKTLQSNMHQEIYKKREAKMLLQNLKIRILSVSDVLHQIGFVSIKTESFVNNEVIIYVYTFTIKYFCSRQSLIIKSKFI